MKGRRASAQRGVRVCLLLALRAGKRVIGKALQLADAIVQHRGGGAGQMLQTGLMCLCGVGLEGVKRVTQGGEAVQGQSAGGQGLGWRGLGCRTAEGSHCMPLCDFLVYFFMNSTLYVVIVNSVR